MQRVPLYFFHFLSKYNSLYTKKLLKMQISSTQAGFHRDSAQGSGGSAQSTFNVCGPHRALHFSQNSAIHSSYTAARGAIATATATNITTIDSRWSPSAYFPCLGSPDRQSMDPFRHSRRLQNTFYPASSPVFTSNSHGSLQQRTTENTTPSNLKPPSKTGNRTGSGIGIFMCLQPNVLYSQKERRISTGIQSSAIKPARPMPTLHNGKHPTGHKIRQEKRLFHFSGSQRCLSSYTHTPPVPALSPLPMGRQYIPIPNNTIRTFSGSLAHYPHHQTNTAMGPPTGHTHIGVPGRLDSDCQFQRTSTNPDNSPASNTELSGVAHQRPKITAQPFSSFGSPRTPTRQPVDDNSLARIQDPRPTTVYSGKSSSIL